MTGSIPSDAAVDIADFTPIHSCAAGTLAEDVLEDLGYVVRSRQLFPSQSA